MEQRPGVATFGKCSRCPEPRRTKDQRLCFACHSAAMRKHRQTHQQSESERAKSNARAYANVYLRRGKIARANCADCGWRIAQMHHEDYGRPIDVTWLCRPCHLARHRAMRHMSEPPVLYGDLAPAA